MSYNEFSIDDLKRNFGLRFAEELDSFTDVAAIPVSDLLLANLRENIPLALAISTEKARSEMIITPVLIEVRRQLQRRVSLFSGIEFSVDPERGLKGTCDYLLSLSPEQLSLEAPVVAVVEAKNENMKQGLSQCIAELVAVQIFNRQRHAMLKTVYGVVTTGSSWKFLWLEEATVHVDMGEYYIREVERIVGIIVHMLKSALGEAGSPHAG
jgi:hypothetical protein